MSDMDYENVNPYIIEDYPEYTDSFQPLGRSTIKN